MPLRAFIAALVLAVVHGQVAAADVIGYSEAFDTLYRVDLTTRSAEEIGRATPPGITRYPTIDGLTYSPTGRLYGVADAHGPKILLQINAANGLANVIGTIDTGSNQSQDLALAFTADGRLWMSTVSGDFWQIDPVSAAATKIGNLGVKITGMTSQGNLLYGAGSQGNNNLYLIDPAKATASLVGAYGSSISYVTAASPAFDANGQLWVMLDYVPPPDNNVPEWSDLATGTLDGSLQNRGQVTAPPNSTSFTDLRYIGLRGFAITAPTGTPPVATAPTPAISWRGLIALALLLGLAAGTRLRSRRPI